MRGSWPHLVQFSPYSTSSKDVLVLEADQANCVDIIKLVEKDQAEEERESRTSEFELRAKNIGITEAK